MPWKVTNVLEQRISFVVRALHGQESMSALCREFGISRQTGYKWLKRHREIGSFAQLQERSRRPHKGPNRTPAEIEERVIELRKHYGWGAKKLHVLLAREGIEWMRSGVGSQAGISDAAMIYRDSLRAEARWFPKLPGEGRGDAPLWMRELPVWTVASGARGQVVYRVKEFARCMGLRLAFTGTVGTESPSMTITLSTSL